jgi:membrane-bound serine protease (ClpP class)
LLLAAVCLVAVAYASHDPSSTAREIPIDGAIGPAISKFVVDEIQEADSDGVALIILRLDTPGGLSSAMRNIVKAILASPVPVIGYVAPSGARAASAGTYILYATHIAAMAPATNLGAATPIEIGGGSGGSGDSDKDHNNQHNGDSSAAKQPSENKSDLSNASTERRKQVNDAVAYIRGLAERRDRNADWAEKAVRQAASLTATKAQKKHVVNLLADNERELLQKIDGHTVDTASGTVTLHSKNLSIQQRKPGWRTELLAIVTNPTVAYLLFMIGIIGLAAEAFTPGVAVPGVVGAISLVTALYSFHLLPVGYGGAALIILGVLLIVAEAFVPSFGALGLGGIAAIVFGSIMLMDSGAAGYNVSMGVVIGVAIAAACILGLMVWVFARSRGRRVETGHEGLIGLDCTALGDFAREGRVQLRGESWHALSETPVTQGQTLTVTAVDGLTVYVRPPGPEPTTANTGREPEGN